MTFGLTLVVAMGVAIGVAIGLAIGVSRETVSSELTREL